MIREATPAESIQALSHGVTLLTTEMDKLRAQQAHIARLLEVVLECGCACPACQIDLKLALKELRS